MHFCKTNLHVWEKIQIEGAIHLRSHSIPLIETGNVIFLAKVFPGLTLVHMDLNHNVFIISLLQFTVAYRVSKTLILVFKKHTSLSFYALHAINPSHSFS